MADVQEYSVSINFKTNGTEKTKNEVKQLQGMIEKLKTTAKIGATLGAIGIAAKKAGQAIFNFGSKTAEYIEVMNLFRTSMGGATGEAQEFIDKAERMLGLDPSNMMNAVSSFYNMAEGLGISSDRAYTMSENLTQLSADLMSLANIPFEQAQQKIMAGFTGLDKGLRQYGVSLSVASLQETAYALGINEKVQNMTKAQKTELYYYQMMTALSKNQGDLAKSLSSPANAIRVMQTEFKALARAVGTLLIPIMMKLIPVIRAITQLIMEAAKAIADFFHLDLGQYDSNLENVGNLLVDDIGGGIEDIGDAAEDTTKKLNKMLMPFDELNNISSNTGAASSGVGGIGAGGTLLDTLPTYNMFKGIDDKLTPKVEEIKTKFKELLPIIGTVAGILGTIWAVTKIAKFIEKVQNLLGLFDKLGTAGNVLRGVLGLALEIGGAYLIYKGVQHLIEDGITPQSVLEILGGTTLIAAGLALQFKSVVPLKLGLEISLFIGSAMLLYKGIKKTIDEGFTPEGLLMILGGAIGVIAAGVFVFKTAAKLRIPVETEVAPKTKGGDIGGDLASSSVSLKTGANSLMKMIGVATAAIAVLGGLALVIHELTEFLDVFSESGLSVNDTLGLLGGTLGIITVAFSAMMLVMDKLQPSWTSIAAAAVIFVGLTAVLWALQGVIVAIGESGMQADEIFGAVAGLMATMIVSAAALVALGEALQSPVAMAGVLVVVAAIAAVLFTLKETLPTILDTIGKFVNTVAPSVINIINAIGDVLDRIVKTIGEVLPPIIDALGRTFEKIFNGISRVVSTVGNAISGVLNGVKGVIKQVGDTVSQVAGTIIWFINELGPSVERLTDSIIRSAEKMVNAVISAVEYLVNRLVDAINGLVTAANQVPGVNLHYVSSVSIPRYHAYAEGGYPEDGELFWANENGPELVGKIGNRTAVANQNQIVDAVSKGVYDAVVSANAQSGSNQSPYIVVNLGNEQLYKGYGQYRNEQANMYGISV
jgi:hypothetical protein